jgi:hypothetical protein
VTAVDGDAGVDDEGFDEAHGAEPDDGEVDDESEESDWDEEDEEDGDREGRLRRAPWHFKILAVGTVIYLGWRLYQGIGWLVHHA